MTMGDEGVILASEQNLSAQVPLSYSLGCGLRSDEPVPNKPPDNPTLSEATTPEGHQHSDQVFQPIPVPAGYPELDYKPVILRSRSMLCVLAFHLIVLGLLIALLFVKSVSFSSQYGYFAIQILPPILGTITTSLWGTITITLCRMWPYISSASGTSSASREKDSARQTILACYFPMPGIGNIIRNGDGLLAFTRILWTLSSTVLAFKAALLNTSDWNDYWEATVAAWALYALIAFYIMLIACLMALIFHLHEIRTTGLRWDPVSIVDHLKPLLTTACTNASGMFVSGWDTGIVARWVFGTVLDKLNVTILNSLTSMTSAQSLLESPMASVLLNPKKSRFFNRTIKRETAALAPTLPVGTSGAEYQYPLFADNLDLATMHQVSNACYRFVYFNVQRPIMVVWTGVALVLFGLLLAAAILDVASGIDIQLPSGVASFLLQFLPVFIVELYTWFWEDADIYCRATQPFVGMHEPNFAAKNLLLNYTCLPPVVVTYAAIRNKHWKVARVSAISLLQRLLPILVAGMVTVVDEDDHCTIYASLPLLITSLIFLGSYIVLIPLEVNGDRWKRHLPRNYLAIADLISWCYASSLLRCDALDASRHDGSGHVYEQWQVEAELRMKRRSYQFGAYKSELRPGTHCIGFDEEDKVEPVDFPDERSLRRRRHRANHNVDEQMTWEMSALTGLDAFKERPKDPTANQIVAPRKQEEERTDQS